MADEIHADPWFLQICLATAVPLSIEHYQSWSPFDRQVEGERLGDCISTTSALLVKMPTNRAYKHEGTAAGPPKRSPRNSRSAKGASGTVSSTRTDAWTRGTAPTQS